MKKNVVKQKSFDFEKKSLNSNKHKPLDKKMGA